jgi:hypothetical protein
MPSKTTKMRARLSEGTDRHSMMRTARSGRQYARRRDQEAVRMGFVDRFDSMRQMKDREDRILAILEDEAPKHGTTVAALCQDLTPELADRIRNIASPFQGSFLLPDTLEF